MRPGTLSTPVSSKRWGRTASSSTSVGIVVDEGALVAALKDGTIRAAGLDVFANEPNVPTELIALPNAVLLPHVGSASVHTRNAMAQLVVDNLKSWFHESKPLTPEPGTPADDRVSRCQA